MKFVKRLLSFLLVFNGAFVYSVESINALFVTDDEQPYFANQASIITKGLNERCNLQIDWTITKVNQLDADVKFDVVVYHQLNETQIDQFDSILRFHKEGTPALILDRVLHQNSGLEWLEFCGAEVKKNGASGGHLVRLEKIDHSIIKSLPGDWMIGVDKASEVTKAAEHSVVLATARSVEKGSEQPVLWTHVYNKKSRVFATTLGIETENKTQYLDLISASFVWAINRGNEEAVVQLGDGLDRLYQTKLKPGKNLFSGQTVSSSSDFSANAVDGNPLTLWTPDPESLTQWLFVGMDEVVHSKAITIFWNEQFNHLFQIGYSLDGRDWKELYSGDVKVGGSDISLIDCDIEFKYLRIFNPEQGTLNSIREIAGYSSTDEVPFHVRTFSNLPVVPSNETEVVATVRQPVLGKQLAFSILDDPAKKTQWELAFEDLCYIGGIDVVEGIISRLETTKSGSFRHKGLAALGELYRDQNEATWPGSVRIEQFLNQQLGSNRINPEFLLSIFTRHLIPLKDVNQIFGFSDSFQSAKQLQIRLLEKNRPLPPRANLFLRKTLRDYMNSTKLRIMAVTMLSDSSDLLGLQDAFMLVAKSDNNQLNQARNLLLYNNAWREQLEWLGSKTKDDYSDVRTLAWQILVRLLNDPESHKDTVDYIVKEIVDSAGEVNSYRYRTFLKVANKLDNLGVIKVIERSTSNSNYQVANLASELLKKLEVFHNQEETMGLSVEQLIEALAKEKISNNVANGGILYKQRCAVCHDQAGLSMHKIVAKSNRDSLLKSILDPSSRVKEGFLTHEFELSDGQKFKGFISRRTAVITELTDQIGNCIQLPNRSVRTQSLKIGSVMRSDLTKDLTLDQLSDLLVYIEGL